MDRTLVTVPRRWLMALTALVVVPWIIAAGLFVWPATDEAPAGPVSPEGSTTVLPDGPWGRLTATPTVVSPPLEYISTDWGPVRAPAWHFPGASPEQIEAFLVASGLGAGVAAELRASARPDPKFQGLVVRPDPGVVQALDADVRARIYLALARSPLNPDQAHSYRFHGESIDAWLGSGLISPETRELVEPLIYRDGGFLHFADLDLVRARITDDEELRRLAKTLMRQTTVVVEVSAPAPEDVPRLAEYWGRGGRRTDLLPLIESTATVGPDPEIDLVHLLPVFARNNLYRYPKLVAEDFDRPVIANCLWTALNFFEDEPDDRYLDVGVALSTLKRDYYVIEHGFQLGDVVAFLDERDNIFHVAVFLAADLVFTKNGTSPTSPWTIMPLDDVKGFYRTRAAEPRLIFHRRGDL